MENTTRQTKQRAVILKLLRETTAHPNAATLYDEARSVMPNISLGTVYRNLRFLEEGGVIRKLVLRSGVEHFDGNLAPHHHFVCRCCGRVLDIFPEEGSFSVEGLKKYCGTKSVDDYLVESAEVLFYGVCPDCRKSNE